MPELTSTPMLAIIAAGSIFLIAILYFFMSGPRARATQAKNTELDLAAIAELKKRIAGLASTASVEDKVKLADECMKLKMHAEALDLYTGCLQGTYATDQDIKFKLAKAYYVNQSYDQARNILIQLQGDRTEFKPNHIQFLMAKISEATGDLENALHEYARLADILPGEEVSYHQGALLKKMGKKDEGNAVFKQIIKHGDQADNYYYEAQQEWIQLAREGLKSK